MIRRIFLLAPVFCLWMVACPAPAQTNFATLTTDGGWCWYSDPRALFHNGKLYLGYVAPNRSKTVLDVFDPSSGAGISLWNSGYSSTDDHNVPGLSVREDGKLLALYTTHGGDNYFRIRVSNSTNPVVPGDWSAEQLSANAGAGVTYCNPFRLSGESNRIYNFSRCLSYNPTVFTSTNGGLAWTAPQRFIATGAGGVRPYAKYCSDGVRRIDVLYTDGHPRDVANSLYHLYYQGGAFYKTDGSFIRNYADLPILHDSGERGSVIYQYSDAAQTDPNQWIPTGRAWCWEVAGDTNGNPVCVFTVQRDLVAGSTSGTDDRIYYYYGRWTGSAWQKRFIAHAGRPLYIAEDDYAGGICVDPQDSDVIYLSSNAGDPFNLSLTNTALRANNRYEIWKGVTADGGLTFAWTPVTANSTLDNLRPYIPRRNGGEPCVLWFQGAYSSYTSYSGSIVGLFTTAVPVPTNAPVVPLPPAIPPTRVRKANNTTSLNQGASWIGGIAPGSGNLAVWDNTVTAANAVTLGANASWAGILVTNPGGAVSITGNTLTLGASGIDMSGAKADLSVSSSLALGAGDQDWNVTGGRTLTLNTGTFTRGSSATLNIQGSGTVASSMAGLNSTDSSSPAAGIIGPWATIGSGTNTRYATTNGGNLIAYTGYPGVFNWSTTLPNSTNVEISASSAAIGVDRMCNTIRWTGGTATQNYGSGTSANRLFLRGILNAGTGTLTFVKASGGPTFVPGANTAGGSRELVLNAAAAGLVMGVPIVDFSGSAASVVVSGAGTNAVVLNAANTYTGGTTLNAGGLVLGNAGGLGSSSGPLAVNGGTLDLGGFSPTVAAVTITGGAIQNGTLTAASFTADTPNSAGVSAVLAGASATLTKNGPGTLSLVAQNTYGGTTTINEGILNCLGRISGPVTVAGGTLGGDGLMRGPVVIQPGGCVSPGAVLGATASMTISNSLSLSGTTLMALNPTAGTNDEIRGLTIVNYGGTLSLSNLSGAYTAAGSFKLFSASAYTGMFANLEPAIPAPGFAWDTNTLAVDGTLRVVQTVTRTPTNLAFSVAGGQLTLSWPTNYVGWRVQAQTNGPGRGLGTNWFDIPESIASHSLILPIDLNNSSVFYRLASP